MTDYAKLSERLRKRVEGMVTRDDKAALLNAADALDALLAERDRLRSALEWLDNNTTFYDVDADWPVDGHNIPVLASVSKRIWYHATDDTTSYPFSAVIEGSRT